MENQIILEFAPTVGKRSIMQMGFEAAATPRAPISFGLMASRGRWHYCNSNKDFSSIRIIPLGADNINYSHKCSFTVILILNTLLLMAILFGNRLILMVVASTKDNTFRADEY